jgi:hypothetical protein
MEIDEGPANSNQEVHSDNKATGNNAVANKDLFIGK